MIISRIELKNWRNFQRAEVNLGSRVFLIGPNASGKSNFLDVFRFLRDITKPGGGLQKAVSSRGGMSKLRCLAARKDPEIEIAVHLSENNGENNTWRYVIGLKQESRGYRQPYLTREMVWKGDELILNRPVKEDREDRLRLTRPILSKSMPIIHLEGLPNFSNRSAICIWSPSFSDIRSLLPVRQWKKTPSGGVFWKGSSRPRRKRGKPGWERLKRRCNWPSPNYGSSM